MARPLIDDLQVEFSCQQAREIIDDFENYGRIGNHDPYEARLWKLLDWHLTDHLWNPDRIGMNHSIHCQDCWDYYMNMKKRCCGG